mgnify:CR=1 FL=1|tara:strand:- start:1041 stop:1631 length:591 start_codon:yes stop_codon:yes gene_type:complete
MLATLLILSAAPVHAADFGPVNIGAPAPAFSLPDLAGETVSLADHKGKVVVLEWFNPGCPFVKQAHGPDGGLKTMANTWSEQGVVWLAINSGSPGSQGTGIDANKRAKSDWNMKHPILLDESGKVGKAYAAKTTPQMVVIDPTGNQVYNGALDNAPFGKPKGGELDAITERVLAAVTNGKPSPQGQSKPYGCSVKY